MAGERLSELEGLMRVAGVSHYMRTNATNIDMVRARALRTHTTMDTFRREISFFSHVMFDDGLLVEKKEKSVFFLSPSFFPSPNHPFLSSPRNETNTLSLAGGRLRAGGSRRVVRRGT